MRATRPLALLFFFLVGGTAWGQTSLQAELSHGPDGHVRVRLTNAYTADARAYIVECQYSGPKGVDTIYTVSREGIGGPPYAVWSGKSVLIGCPLTTTRAEVRAVAYDDGKTEGDADSLARIAAERRLEARDVADDIQILQDALTSIGSAPSTMPGNSAPYQKLPSD
jgi:hypothetical protein